jgi:hypothetical protein
MRQIVYRAVTIAAALSLLCGQTFASSHSDAPLIKQDPQANLTDVYAFMGNSNVLNIVVNCRPFSEPGDGAIYDRFADDALYSIHLTNPVTGAVLRTYNFRFTKVGRTAASTRISRPFCLMAAEPPWARFRTSGMARRISPSIIR